MSRKGLIIEPIFCKGGDPYAEIEWSRRTVETKDEGLTVKQEVEAPKSWSNNAVSTMATKYFRGVLGTSGRETSAKQMFSRVMDEIVKQGMARNIFDKVNGRFFGNEMKVLLSRQMYSFNSPVYFNVGAEKEPQGAACFILVIQDDLRSISEAQRVMIVIFSNGSGSGFNLSALREQGAPLSRGGAASGPNSFLIGYNAWGGIIKSGGIQRRAAMLARLDDWHPDIYNGQDNGTDYISLKAKEERKARALVKKGFTVEEAYQTVACQNANLSVGLSDAFMRAALEGKDWALKSVVGGKVIRVVKASDVLDAIARNSHYCGDPGVQFDDTMNRWNPLIKIARILCTNPCVEFCCIVNTACNLASLNLAAFYDRALGFKDAEFEAAVRLSVIAQDILVDMCGYPTEEITKNSRAYRPLGLGFSNLGGMFLKMGIPYDSDAARTWASSITSRMTATAYLASSELAKVIGPFTGFEENKKGVLSVLKQHRTKFAGVMDQFGTLVPGLDKVEDLWEKAYTAAAKHGVRNCQVTLVPPAGTISHLMDCATTGIEPLLFLVTKKKLAGGGEMTFSPSVGETLSGLGYPSQERDILLAYIKENGNLDGSPIKPQHLPIFDPVYPLNATDRHISIQGQMLMMAAVQPFISGAISKTFGLPKNAPVQDVRDIIVQAWKLGLKAVSVFRDGCKMSQPVVNALSENGLLDDDGPARERLPDDTDAKKHRVVIGGSKMYILPSFYPDGRLGEVFINGLGKDGSTLKALVEALLTAVSIGLQYGIPLEVFAEKFVGTIFSPKGFTSDPKIPSCTSLIDYIFKFLDMNYGDGIFVNSEDKTSGSEKAEFLVENSLHKIIRRVRDSSGAVLTGETCDRCGALAVRKGPCKYCTDDSCPESKNGICG